MNIVIYTVKSISDYTYMISYVLMSKYFPEGLKGCISTTVDHKTLDYGAEEIEDMITVALQQVVSTIDKFIKL